MKLIATKDFSRVPALDFIDLPDRIHENHIHKGATFDVGKAAKFTDLNKTDQQLVAGLVHAGCVGDASDEKVVKAVQAEIAADKKRAENAAKAETASANQAMVAQLTALLAKAAK